MSRWQSLNTWYTLITVSFTVTEPHSVPDSFPIPHLYTICTFMHRDLCDSLVLSYRESGNVCKRRLKLSSTSGNLFTDKSSQMIGRWTGEFFASINIMAWILNCPAGKQGSRKNIILWNSIRWSVSRESYKQVEFRLFDAPVTNQAWQMLYWITVLKFAGTFPRMQSEATLKICRKDWSPNSKISL